MKPDVAFYCPSLYWLDPDWIKNLIVAHRRGRSIGGVSKPSLDVMRRSTVTTTEIRRLLSKPCPVIRNLFPPP